MSKFLKIAVWNANGLTKNAAEVKAFILDQNLDILLISETHFTHKSYFKVPKYSIYHTLHPDGTAHGGTAVIIKDAIKHHEIEAYKQPHLQATSVAIEDWKGPLTITAVYSPPKHDLKIEQYEHFFQKLGKPFHCRRGLQF